jgi:SH3 domain-containing YSC84-like protein 1
MPYSKPQRLFRNSPNRGTRRTLAALLAMLFILPVWAADKSKDEETLRNASTVLHSMLSGNNIPPDVLSRADCVIVLPSVKKFGFGVGGSGGRGPMSCRQGKNFSGKWSPPAMYSIGGASFGLQVGGSSTDVVLLVMAEKAVESILNGKTKLGSDATAAAGPSGATSLGTVGGSDILTYGRAKGLFAGMSLGGATLEPDTDANQRLYGKDLGVRDILLGKPVKMPAGGQPLVTLLNSKIVKHSN